MGIFLLIMAIPIQPITKGTRELVAITLKTSTADNIPPNTTISFSPEYTTGGWNATNVQLMPDQDFTKWEWMGGIVSPNEYTCLNNHLQLDINMGTLPDGYIYKIRALTNQHALGSSFEFEMCPTNLWWAEIHVTEESGYITASDGINPVNVMKEKPVNEFYDIQVQVFNSNFTYRLWVDGVNTGMHGFDTAHPQVAVHYVVLTSNSGVIATFSNYIGTTFINAVSNIRLHADGTDGDTITIGAKVYAGSTEIAPWTIVPNDYSLQLGYNTNELYHFYYCGIDSDGNNETLRNATLFLDTTAPVTTEHGAYFSGSTYYAGNVTTFSFSTIEAGSGVNQTWYEFTPGTSWLQYTAPFSIVETDGAIISLSWCSWDNAGNNESINTRSITWDNVAPVTTIAYTPVSPPSFVTPATPFLMSTVEAGSGVDDTLYKYPGIQWTIYTGSFTLIHANHTGNVVIQYHSNDSVGNMEAVKSITVYLVIVYGVHVRATYYTLSGQNDIFDALKTFVNGSRTYDSNFVFTSSCLFNLTIKDPFNAVIYSQILNTNITGNTLDLILNIQETWFINNHDFLILLNITRGNITVPYSLNSRQATPSNMKTLYLALGTYTVDEYYVNKTQIFGVNESRVHMFQLSDPYSFYVNLGWVNATGPPIENLTYSSQSPVVVVFWIGLGFGLGVGGMVFIRQRLNSEPEDANEKKVKKRRTLLEDK